MTKLHCFSGRDKSQSLIKTVECEESFVFSETFDIVVREESQQNFQFLSISSHDVFNGLTAGYNERKTSLAEKGYFLPDNSHFGDRWPIVFLGF